LNELRGGDVHCLIVGGNEDSQKNGKVFLVGTALGKGETTSGGHGSGLRKTRSGRREVNKQKKKKCVGASQGVQQRRGGFNTKKSCPTEGKEKVSPGTLEST